MVQHCLGLFEFQTGSAVFDFEGDGAAEIVYADEHIWILMERQARYVWLRKDTLLEP